MKKLLTYLYLVFGLGLMVFSGVASANCAAIQVSAAACAGQQVACLDLLQAGHPECFGGASNTAASTQGIHSTVVQQMLGISKAIEARTLASQSRPGNKTADSGQYAGMAAGNSTAQWNAWGSVSYDKNRYDRGVYTSGGNTHTNSHSIDITNAVIGGDYQLSPTVALGLSAAFDHSNGTGTSYNFSTATSNGVASIGSNGYTIAPYVGWQISQNLSLDASLGAGHVNSSIDGATAKANRTFYGTNLNYVSWLDKWQIAGKASFLHGEERYGNQTSSLGAVILGTAVTNKMDQMNLGARAGYGLNDSVMPYFGLTYTNDISRSTTLVPTAQVGSELGKNAWLWAVGVDLFSVSNSLTGGVSFSHETGRTYSKNNNSLVANINFRF